jgi:hypothetical protein
MELSPKRLNVSPKLSTLRIHTDKSASIDNDPASTRLSNFRMMVHSRLMFCRMIGAKTCKTAKIYRRPLE